MSKREVPKLKKEKFSSWKILTKLHQGGIGDHSQSSITTEHVDPTRALAAEDLKMKKEHNQTMVDITSTLSYVEFNDIKWL